ncbi:WAT1-related protein At1g25270-like [Papaver somniferum]|uniref:WAT1-related protein At1g25270-like n=1 Tax=Papaver somniferum TaxID=3469 RepID=UPI000E6FD2A6|nr:WAT1-related protein At1g25270-like [Papaver somniferum]
MVLVQIISTGMTIAYKLAINDEMNLRILIAYRSIFATIFIIPIAFFVEKGARPKLTWTILFQSFLCALFGFSLSQNMYIESMHLTSATFPAAMTNLIPAITFTMAVIFRLEKLRFRSLEGRLKVGGTVLGIGGAMFLTFYRGLELPMWSSDILHIEHGLGRVSGIKPLGAILSIGSCVSYSLWLIIQTKLSQSYPCYYSSTALIVSMASVQSAGFALCTVRDWSEWKLGWNVRLFSVIYSGNSPVEDNHDSSARS